MSIGQKTSDHCKSHIYTNPMNWFSLFAFYALWWSHLKISFPFIWTEVINMGLCGKILLLNKLTFIYTITVFLSSKEKEKKNYTGIQLFTYLTYF